MPLPLAFFLSSSYYGQRLHGDPRGSVDDEHNLRGTPYLAPDASRHASEAARMIAPATTFTPLMRNIASAAILEFCSFKRLFLFTHDVRSTHFHMIVNCGGPADPDRVLGQVKARITRVLREAGTISMDGRVWTEKGSTRWINHENGLRGAIAYVNNWQTGPNRELVEANKREFQERLRSHREWLRSLGLPEDGRGVVLDPTHPPEKQLLQPTTTESPPPYEPGA